MDATVSPLHRTAAGPWPRLAALRAGWRRLAGLGVDAPRSVALALLAVLLAATLWIWRATVAETTAIGRERFDFKLAESQLAIGQRLLAYEQILRGGAGLVAARPDVSRDEWRDYVRTLEIEKNFPGIQGMAHVAALRADQLPAHLRRVHAEGFPEYRIHPAGERAEVAAIVYIEPFDWRNLRAFGYDLLTEPALQAALLRASDSGLPAASGKVRLVMETGDGVQNGFVMCLPVYRPGADPATPDERRAALTSYVCAPFRMQDLMQGILGPDTLPNIRLQIFDGDASAGHLMFDSLEGAAAAAHPASFRADRTFEFGGHRWTLGFVSLPAFDAGVDSQRPRLVLGSGVLVSVLLSAVVWALLLNRRRARQLAAANGGLQAEIEERTELEAELKRARYAAEAANQAKSDFLANVSHELRTPLTLILAPLEQLRAAAAPPADWCTQLDRAQRNALLLMNRVNDILDFSKAEAGKFELRPQAVDLVQVVGTLAEDAAVAAAHRDCVLTWEVEPALGRVWLDLGHFEKIVLNLVSNAIKFTPPRGTIHVRAVAVDADRFEFAVQDSGVGIAPDDLPRLFERFSQVDNSATRAHGGTGIGLALVKELVTLMGGTVGVTSEAGHGSRFFVRLPRGGGPAADQATAAGPAAGADGAMGTGSREAALRQLRWLEGSRSWAVPCGKPVAGAAGACPQDGGAPAAQGPRPRVLVVDDSPEMLAYVAELLSDACDVITAEDGEQAWARLQCVPVEAVVSDVMMPRLDGFGLTARIKASAGLSHVPVILLTARGGADASVSGLQTGADDYIAKPFSPLELRARVQAVLRMAQVQAELRARSRQAGMAQIAANVLHNVGNVLNSVNISTGVISATLQASRLPGLGKAVRLLQEHGADLPRFLAEDDRGRLLPGYLERLAGALATEQQAVTAELGQLTRSIDHIKEIVATQQSHAKGGRATEAVPVAELVEDALRINGAMLARHPVTVVKDLAELPLLLLDRHRVLLILVNLVSNAARALEAGPDQRPRCIRLQVAQGDGNRLRIQVADNGEGIPPENMTRIFSHGFTTRTEGHGFGLHSSALAAREMGGTLTAHSDGPGRGATFVLDIPFQPLEDTP
jgi:signal transduction histidine kinase